MRRPKGSEEHLTPAGEAEWARWRRHLEMADQFWLAFVFARSPDAVHILERRTEQMLRRRAHRQVVLAPSSPEELERAAVELLERTGPKHPTPNTLGCVWIEAIYADAPGAPVQRWASAWEQALLALNQARQPLRHRLSAGLAIALLADFKPRVPAIAPDLWSSRTLVLDLPAAPRPRPAEDRQRPAEDRPRPAEDRQRSKLVRRSAAKPLHLPAIAAPSASPSASPSAGPESGDVDAEHRRHMERLREAERLDAQGKSTEALEIGHAVVADARAHGDDTLLAIALAAVAEIESNRGDPVAAGEHLAETVNLIADREGNNPRLIDFLGILGRMMLHAHDPVAAAEVFERQVSELREALAAGRPNPEALRSLTRSLEQLGDAREVSGDLTAAAAAHEESLTIARRLLDTDGASQENLRDLALALANVGDASEAVGDLAAAAAAFEESLLIARRLFDTGGPTPENVEDLAFSLVRLGDVREAAGDLAAATALHAEALALEEQFPAKPLTDIPSAQGEGSS